MTVLPRVTFNLPTDSQSVIEYLKEENESARTSKLYSIQKMISSPETEDATILSWLVEFRDRIFFFEKEHRELVNSILKLKWYLKDQNFVSVYKEFLLNLVTAHVVHLHTVLDTIVTIFATDLPEEIVKHNVHSLMEEILKLVPMSQRSFCSLLSDKFPYVGSSSSILLCYVQNLFVVSSYLPSWRVKILELIIEKLLNIDVKCSREIIEEYEEQREEMLHIGEDMDQMALPLAHKLDILMDCVFKYIHSTCYPEGGSLEWSLTKKLYIEMLKNFDYLLLKTHGSCHVQYILFYICSFKFELCEGFLDYLWKKVQNPSVDPVYRQVSAFYIGSLLARAKYINISTVKACFDLICQWIHRYIDAHTSENASVHGTFHAVCQTVFYVFAFRSKELLDMKNGYKYLCSLNFDRMVTCRLNPLRFCDKTVVQNFASISRNHQIAYVYPTIEKNNRNLVYSMANSGAEAVAGAIIQTFFPFDPYLLKRSKHWVESHYRLYNHDQKDEDELMDQVDEYNNSDDMFTYSMSPGFKKSFLLTSMH